MTSGGEGGERDDQTVLKGGREGGSEGGKAEAREGEGEEGREGGSEEGRKRERRREGRMGTERDTGVRQLSPTGCGLLAVRVVR